MPKRIQKDSAKYWIGIDIGKDGAIVVQSSGGGITTLKTPLIGKEFDLHEMRNILQVYVGSNTHVVFEDLRAIFGSSAGSTFSFGFVAGATEAICASLDIPFTKVQAKVWQKEMFVGVQEMRKPDVIVKKAGHPPTSKKGGLDTKAMALVAAKRLFPKVDLRKSQRATNPDNGIVDALLMSEYCRRKYP